MQGYLAEQDRVLDEEGAIALAAWCNHQHD